MPEGAHEGKSRGGAAAEAHGRNGRGRLGLPARLWQCVPKRLMPQRIAARTGDLKLGDATTLMDHLLMVKLDCEIEAIRMAAHIADEGYAVFRDAAREGRRDYELVAEVEAFFRANGVED